MEWNIEPSGTWTIEDKKDNYTGIGQRMTVQMGQRGEN